MAVTSPRSIVVAHQDQSWRRLVTSRLTSDGYGVVEVPDLAALHDALRRLPVDLVIVGVEPDQERALADALPAIRGGERPVPVILIVAGGPEAPAVAALRGAARDGLRRPLPLDGLAAIVGACRPANRGRRPNDSGAAGQPESHPGLSLVGTSPRMREIHTYIERVARSDTNVLITGETGTGKELTAEAIHRCSRRGRKALVSINCAAIPDTLLESELFGHEAGAFTGAQSAKEGQLQLADGGTVFFDEIGDMGSYAQAKILRAIEGKPLYRLGGRRSFAPDIRIIAATNQDLDRAVADGRFRKDLFYRLNVARIRLPALRDRREDIPALASHSIRELNRRFDRRVEGVSEDALELLLRYDWPGNVRELRNVLEAMFVDLPAHHVRHIDLPEEVRRCLSGSAAAVAGERDHLLSALSATRWNKSKAAAKLHWSRMTLYRKMAKYNVRRSDAAGDETGDRGCNKRDTDVTAPVT